MGRDLEPLEITKLVHDLRAPLTALEVATEDLSGIEERRRKLIQDAVERFRAVVERLDPNLRK